MIFYTKTYHKSLFEELKDLEENIFIPPYDERELKSLILAKDKCTWLIYKDDLSRQIGFIVYRLTKISFEICRIGILSLYRRYGAGTFLLNKLKFKLSDTQYRKIEIWIYDGNLPIQLWLRKNGFIATEIKDEGFYLFEYFFTGDCNG